VPLARPRELFHLHDDERFRVTYDTLWDDFADEVRRAATVAPRVQAVSGRSGWNPTHCVRVIALGTPGHGHIQGTDRGRRRGGRALGDPRGARRCWSDLFTLADGRQAEHDIGHGWIRVDGRTVITLVVFGEAAAEPLLGAYALEGLRLAPDPVGRRLMPVPGLLMANTV